VGSAAGRRADAVFFMWLSLSWRGCSGCRRRWARGESSGNPPHTARHISRRRDVYTRCWTCGKPPLTLRSVTAPRSRGRSPRRSANADRAAKHELLDECPAWLRFMSHGEVLFHEAKGLGFLGRGGRVLELYDRNRRRIFSCNRGDARVGAARRRGVLPQGTAIARPCAGRACKSPRRRFFTDRYDAVARHLEVIGA